MDDLMATSDIFVLDRVKHVDLPEYCEVGSLFVIYPLRMVLFECKEL